MPKLDLPEVPKQEKPKPTAKIKMPQDPLASGCAGIVSAWAGLITLLMAIILTGGLIRLVFMMFGIM